VKVKAPWSTEKERVAIERLAPYWDDATRNLPDTTLATLLIAHLVFDGGATFTEDEFAKAISEASQRPGAMDHVARVMAELDERAS